MATSSPVVVDATRPCRLVLNKITLYETKTRYYIVGANPSDTRFRVLKIDRTTTSALHLVEDDVVYDKEQIRDLLSMIELGNRTTGGLHKVVTAYGIVGFIRFTGSYYICLITQRSAVAVLGGHYIYHIDGTMLLNIATDDRSVRTPQENRYLSLFHSVDMTKNFYFSYTYDLTHTLQFNMTQTKDEDQFVYNDMFVWNHYLLNTGFESLRSNSDWILPVIYGFVNQSSLNVFGRNLYITLIARRSRFFAGARFLKRGVNNQGYVANEVETEQIVHEQIATPFHRPGQLFGNPAYTAYVQHRGSIPLYWSQDTSNMTPKPPIEINTVDPYFSAAALHLDHLLRRYGSPIILLNLIKRKERIKRESKLGSEFEQAINYLNQFLPERNRLLYIAWDMSRADKNPNEDVFEVLEEISEQAIQRTDFFHSGPEPVANMLRSTRYTSLDASGARKPFRLQNGVLRSNCIDCLDRTNTAQNMTGRCALGYQLYALGVIAKPFVAFDSEAVNLLNDMYRHMGNTIALQYGGSQLVNTIESYQKINPWSNQSRDMIETFRRYYSNSFIDSEKQDAINLFLGNFVSRMGEPSLWELGTDYHLHNKDLTNRRLDRSYVHWWSDDALRSKYETAKHIPRAMVIHPIGSHHHLDEENEHPLMSYWIEYYRPRLYTSFSRLFAFNMNSTLKKTHGLDGTDVSPLTSVDAQWHSGTITKRAAPRLWLPPPESDSDSDDQSHTQPTFLLPQGMIDNSGIAATPSLWPQTPKVGSSKDANETRRPAKPAKTKIQSVGGWDTDGVNSLLAEPSVDPTEAQEYQRYVNQFKGQVHFQTHWEDTLGLTSGAQLLASESKQAAAVDDTKVSYLTNHPDYATYFDYVKSANTAMVTGCAPTVSRASDTNDVYYQYMQSTEEFLAQPAGQPRQLASHSQYEAYRHWLKAGKFRFPKKK